MLAHVAVVSRAGHEKCASKVRVYDCTKPFGREIGSGRDILPATIVDKVVKSATCRQRSCYCCFAGGFIANVASDRERLAPKMISVKDMEKNER